MLDRGAWELMLHYNVFVGVVAEAPAAGSTEGFTTNWLMGMARYASKGTLTLRGMLSLEAPPLGRDGYPLLMQTGETAHGQPLVDRQHPHDLFMELAAKYDLPVGQALTFEVYGAVVGEPALGPSAFPHRPSAATMPLAPLGHHWEDSTHISFGVVTAGVFWRRVKLEASAFNGREPDEDRYDIDLDALDSYSARLSVNPAPNWSFQVSAGHLEQPESLEPQTDVRRITASATYLRPRHDGSWASTFVWGENAPSDQRSSQAWLLESSLTIERHAIFGRAEYVQKDGQEFGLSGSEADASLPVFDLVAGYSYRVAEHAGTAFAVGGQGSVGFVGTQLADRYGTSHPLSAAVFVQIRPAAGHGQAMHMHMH
jgi:hypothetical protein